jgi:sulfonate transport system ATP-binding protein
MTSRTPALADRVVVLRDGRIALDVAVDLPRPRGEAVAAEATRLQSAILREV